MELLEKFVKEKYSNGRTTVNPKYVHAYVSAVKIRDIAGTPTKVRSVKCKP